MARKTRREIHDQYKQRLEFAKNWRDEEGYDRTWRRLNDLYRGKHWPMSTLAQNDLIAVNLAFSTVNVIAPSVAVNHPKIVVQATTPQESELAVLSEAVINYLWRHYDFRQPFRRAVKDFLIFGHGWLKVGWRFVEQERSLGDTELEDLYSQSVAEADLFAMEQPEFAGDLPTDEEIAANLPSTAMKIVEDQPFVERVSPFDVFVDPEATCMEDIRWIAQRIIRPLEEVKKDKRYKASVRKNLSPDAGIRGAYDNPVNEAANYLDDVERVTLYEYYDVASNTMSVCAENSDEFLADPIAMPYAYGQPFVMLRNYDIPDYFYPMGDLESIESLQLELDKTRSQLMNDRKRYGRKYLYHERSFGPEGREALESDEDGRLVPVIDENKPLSDVVMPMPQTPLSPEIYAYSNIIEDDINTVSGVNEYARGQMPEIRRTATEASIIADAANARAADKLAIIELGIGFIARRVLQLMQQYMTGEQVARITGRDGVEMFFSYTREDIAGEYDFTVEGGSTMPMNDTIRKQQAVSLLNAISPLVGTVIDPSALAMHVLREGFDIKNPERFMMQQPAPDQVVAEEEAGVPTMPMDVGVPEEPVFAPTGGVPPELLSQLQNQMGVELPFL
jgi:hypothetical protein|tara:strand:- start:83 stop:1942 length:1860 start_codon:yes stop_codon:yes gene_type:complete